MSQFNWVCPFCNHAGVITSANYHLDSATFHIENAEGPRIVYVEFIVCPNEKCKRFVLRVELHSAHPSDSGGYGSYVADKLLKKWSLIPASSAKVFPSYIPEAIQQDYEEACAIKELSPKASATLSRRCLQGMIRNFWGEKKRTLKDEIEAIQDKVDSDTWEAIDTVRHVGNIGAHMEEDIDLIIDVEPEEASLLIGLIETLIQDWYITRHERKERLEKIVAMKDEKVAQKEPVQPPEPS